MKLVTGNLIHRAAAVLGLSLVCLGSVTATPIIDIDFAGNTTGQTPLVTAAPAAGAVITRPSSTYVSGGGSLLVQNDYTVGSSTLEGNSVVFGVATSQNAQLNIRANASDFTASQDFSLQFDLLVNGSVGDLTRNSLRVNFYNQTFSSGGYQASLILVNNGAQLISGSNTTTFANSWAAGEVLHMQLNVLYSTNTFEAWVNGSQVGSISLSALAPGGIQGVQFLNGASNSSFELAVANIQGSAVPEPAVTALLGVAGLWLLFRRRSVLRQP